MLSHDTGAKLHLCHCSTEDSVMMVDLAKQKNVKVTAEVCPHHFTLTSDDIRKIAPEMDVEKNVIASDADADTNFKSDDSKRRILHGGIFICKCMRFMIGRNHIHNIVTKSHS